MYVYKEGFLFILQPLNPNPKSRWQTFFKDNEVLLQIDRDVRYVLTQWFDMKLINKTVCYKASFNFLVFRRLCPDIAFFQRPTEFPNKNVVTNFDAERLYKRVENGTLKSANVTRKGLGVTKVISTKHSVVSTRLEFGGFVIYAKSLPLQITLLRRQASEEYPPLPKGQEAHWEVVERLLFVYAKLNPGQGYVQV